MKFPETIDLVSDKILFLLASSANVSTIKQIVDETKASPSNVCSKVAKLVSDGYVSRERDKLALMTCTRKNNVPYTLKITKKGEEVNAENINKKFMNFTRTRSVLQFISDNKDATITDMLAHFYVETMRETVLKRTRMFLMRLARVGLIVVVGEGRDNFEKDTYLLTEAGKDWLADPDSKVPPRQKAPIKKQEKQRKRGVLHTALNDLDRTIIVNPEFRISPKKKRNRKKIDMQDITTAL